MGHTTHNCSVYCQLLISNIFLFAANALVNLIAVRGEESTGGVGGAGAGTDVKQATGDVTSGTCACKDDARPTRFSSVAEEARIESINFENALQNHVSYMNLFCNFKTI